MFNEMVKVRIFVYIYKIYITSILHYFEKSIQGCGIYRRYTTRIFYQNNMIFVDEYPVNSFIVFDDCILIKQNIMQDYFLRRCYKNISCVYSSRNWTKLNFNIIQNNLNFLCVFKQNSFYIKKIYNEVADIYYIRKL